MNTLKLNVSLPFVFQQNKNSDQFLYDEDNNISTAVKAIEQMVQWPKNLLQGDQTLPLLQALSIEDIDGINSYFIYSPRSIGQLVFPEDEECALVVFDYLQTTYGKHPNKNLNFDTICDLWDWGSDCEDHYQRWIAICQGKRLQKSVQSLVDTQQPAQKRKI